MSVILARIWALANTQPPLNALVMPLHGANLMATEIFDISVGVKIAPILADCQTKTT